MRFASVRTLKAKLCEYLNSGQKVIVTKHGVPVALLTPLSEKDVKELADKGVAGLSAIHGGSR